MDPNAVILDISSDEEVDPNSACEPVVVGVDKGLIGDFDWLKELMDDNDVVEERAGYSDDVVLVGEVFNNPKQKLKPSVGKPVDDDDCVILEDDPDKLVTLQNDTTSDSDDVLVVGQKGQVACRDFPHPRHLCANFSFTSTPHEMHCNQCHCYVCESLAPCLEWGTGSSNSDHCHATEKDEFWRVQKTSFKNSNKSPPPVSGVHSTYLAAGVTQMNPDYPVPPLFSFPYPVAQTQVCRPTPIHPVTVSTNFSTPSIVSQGRTQQSGYVVPRHKFQLNLISQQLHSTSNRTIPRGRRNNVSNLGAQFNSPRAVFKGTGSVRLGSTTTRCDYSANNYGSQYRGNAPSGVTSNNGNSMRYEDFVTPSTPYCVSSQPMNGSIATTFVPLQQNIRSVSASSMSSQPELSSHSMSSQPELSSHSMSSQPELSSHSMSSQLELSSQPPLSLQLNMGNLENWVPSLHQETFQSHVVPPPIQNSSQLYPVPSLQQESSQPYVGSMFVNSPSPQPLESYQPYLGSMFVNSLSPQPLASSCSNAGNKPDCSVPCQPPVCSRSSDLLSNCNWSTFQLGNQTPSLATAKQSYQQPPMEMSQLQSVALTHENPFLRDFDPQYNGDIGLSSLNFIETCPWDKQPVPGEAETTFHFGFMLSPEPALPMDGRYLV